MQWLRDLREWLYARHMNRRSNDAVRSLMRCLHRNPPGFTACMFRQTYCRTCWAQFRC